jgi:hypothetical protein
VSAAPWAAHFGLARTPFGKSIAAGTCSPRQAHAEAIARISFCVVDISAGSGHGERRGGQDGGAARRRRRRARPHPAPGDLYRQPGVRHPRAVCHHARIIALT